MACFLRTFGMLRLRPRTVSYCIEILIAVKLDADYDVPSERGRNFPPCRPRQDVSFSCLLLRVKALAWRFYGLKSRRGMGIDIEQLLCLRSSRYIKNVSLFALPIKISLDL